MKVNVLTPYRIGGPFYWGQNLVQQINLMEKYNASHIHTLTKLFSTPIVSDANIVHSVVPLSYKLWKKPVILTIHGDVLNEKNIWRFFYPQAIKKADIITTPSYYLMNKLAIDNCLVIPNAVFSDRYTPVVHSDKKTLNVVTLTKFYFKDKSEGVLKIISILDKILKNIDSDINYIIIGGGHYLDYIKKESEKYQIPITFMGMIQNPQKILEASDVFLYYSMHDNFPISILEAMACGLPVVSNNVGAVSEEINNCHDGFVAENDLDYENRVLELVNNSNLRATIGYNARRSVQLKFDWNIVVEKYIKLYEEWWVN